MIFFTAPSCRTGPLRYISILPTGQMRTTSVGLPSRHSLRPQALALHRPLRDPRSQKSGTTRNRAAISQEGRQEQSAVSAESGVKKQNAPPRGNCVLGVPQKAIQLFGERRSNGADELLPFYGKTNSAEFATTK